MSHLTEEGKKLYDTYISAKNAWRKYIEKIASDAYNKRLNELDKKYYKNAYWGYIPQNLKDNIYSMVSDEKRISNKTKKLYRKLSILFHPDKYTKTDKIFIIITSCANTDDNNTLEQIDVLSSDILDCPDNLINKLVEILNDKSKLNNLYQYMQTENSSFINYIDGNIIINETTNYYTETTSCCSDFLNSDNYAWFMGDDKIKKIYESTIYNEKELIEHLKTNACDDEIIFYSETSDNEQIKLVANCILKKKLQEKNDYLRRENEELKNNMVPNIINQINSLKTKSIDELYAYQITNILDLINDININLFKEKYDELIDLLYSKFDIYHYSIDQILKTKHNDIINNYIDCLLIEFNKYLELPPYHKRQESYYLKIVNLLNKCYKIIYTEKIIDTTNKVLDELVIVIQNIKVYNWYSQNNFLQLFNIEKIKTTYIMEYYKIIVNLENNHFEIETNDLKQICESPIDMIRTAGLERVVRNKDKYSDLYKKYYEC